MERSRLWAVGYGRKSAASGQWCMVLGSGVRGQDPSGVGGVLGGVVLFGWAGSEQGWDMVLGSGVRGQGPSSVGGVLGGGVHGQSPSRLVVVGPSRFVECAKGCSRPPSSRQPLRGVLAAAVLSAAVARGDARGRRPLGSRCAGCSRGR